MFLIAAGALEPSLVMKVLSTVWTEMVQTLSVLVMIIPLKFGISDPVLLNELLLYSKILPNYLP